MQRELERILERHAVAEVLFVHGWHVVQPSCDVGVGARLACAADAQPLAPRLTASPDYVRGPLEVLRRAGERLGIRTTYGERWPAAHRNNVMQLFRRAPRTPSSEHCAALASLAAAGRAHAVQLELGAPLRFPGAWRERFVTAAAEAFATRDNARATASDAREAEDVAAAEAPSEGARGVALQLHDRAAGLGVVAGVGSLGRGEVGGRLLLLPGGQRLLLFTGHGRARADGALAVGGLETRAGDGTLEVRYHGPLLDIPDAALYFRDEAAQLGARVADADVELRFAAAYDGWGRVDGRVAFDGTTFRIAARGCTDRVLARLAPDRPGSTLRLTASFGADLALTADLADTTAAADAVVRTSGGRELVALRGGLPPLAPGRLAAPFAFTTDAGDELRCEPSSHVTLLRPLADGLFARVTFGVATYGLGARRGSGFYEHTTAFTCEVAPSEDA